MKCVRVFIVLFGLGLQALAQADEIVIPPLVTCVAVSSVGVEFSAGGGLSDGPERCHLFGERENDGCNKVMDAVNAAIAKCEGQSRRNTCQIRRCKENPQ